MTGLKFISDRHSTESGNKMNTCWRAKQIPLNLILEEMEASMEGICHSSKFCFARKPLFTSQLLHSQSSINLISSLLLLYYFSSSFVFFFVLITDEERIYTVVILEPSHFILCCYFPVNYFVRALMKNSVFLI